MVRRVSNNEAGNIWAGYLIAKLAKKWPAEDTFHLMRIIDETGVSVQEKDNEEEALTGLIKWLVREKFVSVEGINYNGTILGAAITKKSQLILDQFPESLNGKKLGQAMVDAAAEIGKDSAKSTIADLFGQFVGGLVKSAAGRA